jgi:hypothetical protein
MNTTTTNSTKNFYVTVRTRGELRGISVDAESFDDAERKALAAVRSADYREVITIMQLPDKNGENIP